MLEQKIIRNKKKNARYSHAVGNKPKCVDYVTPGFIGGGLEFKDKTRATSRFADASASTHLGCFLLREF